MGNNDAGGAPKVLADFAGVWALTREIEDRMGAQQGHLEGRAVLMPRDGGLDYHEVGKLRLGGAMPMSSERRYFWRQAGQGIAVDFADGRSFHRFRLGGATQASHWCAPDQYEVSYDFSSWPTWRSTWRVFGPRKDYDMVSLFTRLA